VSHSLCTAAACRLGFSLTGAACIPYGSAASTRRKKTSEWNGMQVPLDRTVSTGAMPPTAFIRRALL